MERNVDFGQKNSLRLFDQPDSIQGNISQEAQEAQEPGHALQKCQESRR